MPKQPLQPNTLDAILTRVRVEINNGIYKHSNWKDYTPEYMFAAICDEAEEAGQAMVDDNLTRNPHSMAEELLQVAACCIKAVYNLELDKK